MEFSVEEVPTGFADYLEQGIEKATKITGNKIDPKDLVDFSGATKQPFRLEVSPETNELAKACWQKAVAIYNKLTVEQQKNTDISTISLQLFERMRPTWKPPVDEDTPEIPQFKPKNTMQNKIHKTVRKATAAIVEQGPIPYSALHIPNLSSEPNQPEYTATIKHADSRGVVRTEEAYPHYVCTCFDSEQDETPSVVAVVLDGRNNSFFPEIVPHEDAWLQLSINHVENADEFLHVACHHGLIEFSFGVFFIKVFLVDKNGIPASGTSQEPDTQDKIANQAELNKIAAASKQTPKTSQK